jgi:hypothetical protein
LKPTHSIQARNCPDCALRGGSRLRVLGLGLVLLGLCVFAWGLRYKLSLYQPAQSVSRHMPAAKLLSGKERSPVAAIDLRRSDDSERAMPAQALTGLLLLLLSGMALVAGSSRWAVIPSLAAGDHGRFARAAHFTRPPPRA